MDINTGGGVYVSKPGHPDPDKAEKFEGYVQRGVAQVTDKRWRWQGVPGLQLYLLSVRGELLDQDKDCAPGHYPRNYTWGGGGRDLLPWMFLAFGLFIKYIDIKIKHGNGQ